METIQNVLNAVQIDSAESRNPTTTQPRQKIAVMSRLWEVMASSFMHKWISYAGDPGSAMFDDWSKGLAALTTEQIRDGVNKLPTMPPNSKGEYWPPSLPEFRAMCLPDADAKRVQTYSSQNFTDKRLAHEKKAARTEISP